MIKLNPIKCISDSIKCIFANLKDITVLILQIYVCYLIALVVISFVFGINPLNLYACLEFSPQPSSKTFTIPMQLVGIVFYILSVSLKLSVSRHIILNKPIEKNLAVLFTQKRFWYGLWAIIKWAFCSYLYSFLSLVFFVGFMFLLFVYDLIGGDIDIFVNTSDMVSSFVFTVASMILIYFLTLVFFVTRFIYVPMLAYLDQTASLKHSWKITKGHVFRIMSLFILTYLIIAIVYAVLMLPNYLMTGSIVATNFWVHQVISFLMLYVSILLSTAIAFSYREICFRYFAVY